MTRLCYCDGSTSGCPCMQQNESSLLTEPEVVVFTLLLLSLLQQDFLGLVQAKLQSVQFARVLLRRPHVLPQLSAALLPARADRVDAAAAIPGLLSFGARSSGAQHGIEQLQVLMEKETKRPGQTVT